MKALCECYQAEDIPWLLDLYFKTEDRLRRHELLPLITALPQDAVRRRIKTELKSELRTRRDAASIATRRLEFWKRLKQQRSIKGMQLSTQRTRRSCARNRWADEPAPAIGLAGTIDILWCPYLRNAILPNTGGWTRLAIMAAILSPGACLTTSRSALQSDLSEQYIVYSAYLQQNLLPLAKPSELGDPYIREQLRIVVEDKTFGFWSNRGTFMVAFGISYL